MLLKDSLQSHLFLFFSRISLSSILGPYQLSVNSFTSFFHSFLCQQQLKCVCLCVCMMDLCECVSVTGHYSGKQCAHTHTSVANPRVLLDKISTVLLCFIIFFYLFVFLPKQDGIQFPNRLDSLLKLFLFCFIFTLLSLLIHSFLRFFFVFFALNLQTHACVKPGERKSSTWLKGKNFDSSVETSSS